MDKRPSFRKRVALELFRGIKKSRAKLHELQILYWECTLRCDLSSCLHCGNSCRTSHTQPDMPIADFLRVIDDITPIMGKAKPHVILTGGEPLLREDLERCGMELRQRGYTWGITSNGHLITRERLNTLLAAGMSTVTIGLDGLEEAHDWLRQSPKSFEKAVNAICLLADQKDQITWNVTTYLTQRNFKDLMLFKNFLVDMGVTSWQITGILPNERTGPIPDTQLSDEQYTWIMNFARYCRKEGKIHLSCGCDGFLGNYEAEVRDSIFHCKAGINRASVLADGAISGCPCVHANYYQGNIYDDSFAYVWNNRFEKYRDRKWTKTGQCADCDLFRYCEGNGMHLRDGQGDLRHCLYKHLV